jgi:hypothetical protein
MAIAPDDQFAASLFVDVGTSLGAERNLRRGGDRGDEHGKRRDGVNPLS